MIGLDKYLAYLDKNPKLVIGTLLSIIIIGGLCGGLWIKYLKDNLDTQKNICNEKISLIETNYKSTTQEIRNRYLDFEYDVERIKKNLLKKTETSIEAIKNANNNNLKEVDLDQLKVHLDKIITEIGSLEGQINELSAIPQDSILGLDKRISLKYRPFPIEVLILLAILLAYVVFRIIKYSLSNKKDPN